VSASKPLLVYGAWRVCPALVDDASRDALIAVCQANDANGDYEDLGTADLRAVILGWLAEEYAATSPCEPSDTRGV